MKRIALIAITSFFVGCADVPVPGEPGYVDDVNGAEAELYTCVQSISFTGVSCVLHACAGSNFLGDYGGTTVTNGQGVFGCKLDNGDVFWQGAVGAGGGAGIGQGRDRPHAQQ